MAEPELTMLRQGQDRSTETEAARGTVVGDIEGNQDERGKN